MNSTTWLNAFAVGLGLAAAGVTFLALTSLRRVKLPRIPISTNRARAVRLEKSSYTVLAGLSGVVLASALALGTRWVSTAVVVGFVAGCGISVGVRRATEAMKLDAKRRDVNVLFDVMELYLRAGIPMQRALSLARPLVPSLQQAVNRALSHWSSGTTKALEILREEIGLPEGDILVSLLHQINQAGIGHLEDILRRESKRLEQMRSAAERAKIGLKPLFLVLFRTLPLLASLGMVAGTLFVRVSQIFREAGIF